MTADDPRVAPLAEALRSTGLSLTHQGASQASAHLLAILDRGPLVVGMRVDDHKELLARLLRKGVDPTDWRIIANALDRGPLAVGPGKTCQPEGHDAHDPYRPVIHLDEPGDDVWECRRCGQRLR